MLRDLRWYWWCAIALSCFLVSGSLNAQSIQYTLTPGSGYQALDGATISGKVNIRAFSLSVPVQFVLDGSQMWVELECPCDFQGDPNFWDSTKVPDGTHVMVANQVKATFSVQNQPVAAPPPVPPGPSINVSLEPGVIVRGASATLSWQASNASVCRGSWASGDLPVSGSVTLSPPATLGYNLGCDGLSPAVQGAIAAVKLVVTEPFVPASPECFIDAYEWKASLLSLPGAVVWWCDTPSGLKRYHLSWSTWKNDQALTLPSTSSNELRALYLAAVDRRSSADEMTVIEDVSYRMGPRCFTQTSGTATSVPVYGRNPDGTRGAQRRDVNANLVTIAPATWVACRDRLASSTRYCYVGTLKSVAGTVIAGDSWARCNLQKVPAAGWP